MKYDLPVTKKLTNTIAGLVTNGLGPDVTGGPPVGQAAVLHRNLTHAHTHYFLVRVTSEDV
jgi:hypothetical protein